MTIIQSTLSLSSQCIKVMCVCVCVWAVPQIQWTIRSENAFAANLVIRFVLYVKFERQHHTFCTPRLQSSKYQLHVAKSQMNVCTEEEAIDIAAICKRNNRYIGCINRLCGTFYESKGQDKTTKFNDKMKEYICCSFCVAAGSCVLCTALHRCLHWIWDGDLNVYANFRTGRSL